MRRFDFGDFHFEFYNKLHNSTTGHNTTTMCEMTRTSGGHSSVFLAKDAICHKKDQSKYKWTIGQRVALRKILLALGFTREQRLEVFAAYDKALQKFLNPS